MNQFDFTKEINKEALTQCANDLRGGKLVVFPTETVYGIGANALNEKAVASIFQAKGRPHDNPLIVHVSDTAMLHEMVPYVSPIEKKLIDTFFPGPMTIILPKSEKIPSMVTCGLDTVGIRMPSNEIARMLIRQANVPVAAPSANISGRPSGTRLQDIKRELQDNVADMIDGGETDIGVESTVVKVQEDEVIILRPGKITPQDIEKLGLKVVLDKHTFEEAKIEEKVESPGMKHRHYAPTTETVLCVGSTLQKRRETMQAFIASHPEQKIGVIGVEENREYFQTFPYIAVGKKDDLDGISHHIFTALRQVDTLEVDVCLVEGVEKQGIGIAIMNRLLRACRYHVISIEE